MAITYVDSNFGTLVIPSAVARINVNTPASGLSAFGTVTIIGEADSGPATSAPTENIENNFYTPAQLGAIVTKYGSGRIVDAFKALCAPSNDTNIVGALTRIYVYKTNASTSAAATLPTLNSSFTAYGIYNAALAGALGNQLTYTFTTAQTPVDDATGTFTFIPVPTNGSSAALNYRLSGGSAATVSIAANALPAAVVAASSTGNFLITGGVDRSAVASLAGITATLTVVSGNSATFQLSGTNVFPVSPVAGDLMLIPTPATTGVSVTSTFAGTGSTNCGAWVVTAVSNITSSAIITATKLADQYNVTVATPVNISATFSATVANDLRIISTLNFIDKTSTNRVSFANLASQTVSVTVTGSSVQLNFSGGGFASGLALPQVNDNLYIPNSSYVAGAALANVGWYTVTTVNNVTGSAYITAARVSNGTPVNVSATASQATPNNDYQVLRPWIDGYEKTLEISDAGLTTALSKVFYTLGSTTPATFVSTAASPVVQVATGYKVTAGITRSVDSTNLSFASIGDNVALQLGYAGTSAVATVSATSISFVVTGGAGANNTLLFSNYSTLSALATAINTLTGYSATVASAAVGLLPPTILDQGAFNFATSTAATSYPCRIKKDAYDFNSALSGNPTVVFTQVAFSGLPNPTTVGVFLAGGAKNGSSGAQFTAAFDACQAVQTNFIVPLISQDATADILIGQTDPLSTYTVNAINAYANSHCIAMSAPVQRKNRLAIVSARGSFANAQIQAQAIASSRTALMFQDVKAVNAAGNLFQFQPWYAACIAAGMQAIGLYKSIMRKYANVSGIVSPAGDFSPQNQGQLTQALQAGLLILQAPSTGGYRFVSDQTTYGKDANFVFNSLQVMYTADYMAVDLATAFDNFAVGQPVSVINAGTAKTFLTSKMTQYLQNQLISASGSATAGYDSATVSINGPVMQVGVNAYITNAISFVVITFNVSQVSQSTASA